MRRWSVLAEGTLSFPFPAKVQMFPTGLFWVGTGPSIFPAISGGRLPGKGGKLALQRYVAELAVFRSTPAIRSGNTRSSRIMRAARGGDFAPTTPLPTAWR